MVNPLPDIKEYFLYAFYIETVFIQKSFESLLKSILLGNKASTNKERALALKSTIGALNEKYKRPELAGKLNSSLKSDIYYPNEDSMEVLMFNDYFKVL